MDKGRNMLGVMDETGQLEYGQVYVQYTCVMTQKPVTLTGTSISLSLHVYRLDENIGLL